MPNRQDTQFSLSDDHELLLAAIVRAGGIARDLQASDFEKWDKGKGDPVTDVDIAVDQALKEELLAQRPDYGWLSEETEDDPARQAKEKVWIVDPIDGTRALLSGHPHFTICVALIARGRTQCGAVYNPSTEELYEAAHGQGAKRNGVAIAVSDRQQLEGCRMLGDKAMFNHPDWRRPWPPMEIESRSSIALRMAMVATGEWDGCLTLSGKSDWDLAAADLIVKEAGGRVTDHKGERFLYNRASTRQLSLIAAGPHIHEEILARVRHIDLQRSKA